MRIVGTVIAGALLLLLIAASGYLFLGGTEQAVIETDLGEIVIAFFPREAPEHVKNFTQLTRSGFYDGTAFFRAVPGFVIQGGDPNTRDNDPWNDGMGGPAWTLEPEFNAIPHQRGIVSMARGDRLNTAGSQFFICLDRLPALDHQYTVFGQVVSGMEVADAIARRPKNPDLPEHLLQPVVARSFSIRTVYRLPFIGEFTL